MSKIDEAKVKWERFKFRTRIRTEQALSWLRDNPETLVVIVPGVVAVFKGTTKVASKILAKQNMAHAEKEIRTRCYDPSEGHYWFLKRELSNQEWLLVNNRHKAGEPIGAILMEMNVLK